MRDLHEEHLAEIRTAQEAYNTALDGASQVYADAIHASRLRLSKRMSERLAIWHGDPMPEAQEPAAEAKEPAPTQWEDALADKIRERSAALLANAGDRPLIDVTLPKPEPEKVEALVEALVEPEPAKRGSAAWEFQS